MHNPLVSIVICTYNRGYLLPQTIESALAQKYRPVEIVVLDDGSTDNTKEIIASYGDQIRYFWQKNMGTVFARTAACRLASGKLIAFLDSDDLMPSDRINILYDALLKNPSAVMTVGDWAIIDSDGKFTGNRYMNSENQKDPILYEDGYSAVLWPKVPATSHTTLFRKADGEKIDWFDKKFCNFGEDKDFYARLGQLGAVVHVPKVVSYYRRGHTALTSNEMFEACSKLVLFEKHLKCLNCEQWELKNRLKIRLLSDFKKIAFLKSKGTKLLNSITKYQINKSLRVLGPRKRLLYRWYAWFELPVSNFISKVDKTDQKIFIVFIRKVRKYVRSFLINLKNLSAL